jgi:Rps23 Pro-64 3,4-dihydroxylase Tpa1-like proline 4-hydroxylase
MQMTDVTQEELVGLIEERLRRELAQLQQAYRPVSATVPTRACSIDDLLPLEIATAIHQGFPQLNTMRRMSSIRERKYTFKQLRECAPIVGHVTFALQDPRIVKLVEQITGMQELIPDSRLYAGGISAMVKGDYLHPHIDNSHDSERVLYRRINLLYYITPGWSLANGGNLQLWDGRVRERVAVPSRFNSLVLMETNRHSWHSVDAVVADGTRCCVSNYYFSKRSPDGTEYFHVTDFSAPPEQPVRRLIARLDGRLRTAVRKVKQGGFSRQDYYK